MAKRAELWWMAAGLSSFGALVGFTTGLSAHEGISSELLTSLFAFGGGVLLTWTGFEVRTRRSAASTEAKEETRPLMDLVRVGSGLFAFSLGVLGGLVVGAHLRKEPAKETKKEEPGKQAIEVTAKLELVGPGLLPAVASSPAGATSPSLGDHDSPVPPSPPRERPANDGISGDFYIHNVPVSICSTIRPHVSGGYRGDKPLASALADYTLLTKQKLPTSTTLDDATAMVKAAWDRSDCAH